MKLEEESRKFLKINTHRGLFRYTRLPFGVGSAPTVFQHAMDEALQGINHVISYIDDLLVTAADEQEHFSNLKEVLS